ncbi:hypothetical protein V2J09_000858 [Rumex salicifolius]
MDRRGAMSPVYGRQWSTSSGESMSPAGSPAHPHSRHASLGGTGAFSTIKRNQTVAAKAAARRLAQAMATQAATDDDDDQEDDDLGFRFPTPTSLTPSHSSSDDIRTQLHPHHLPHSNLPAISGRLNRAPSPALGRNIVDNHAVSARSTSTGRASTNSRAAAVVPPTKYSVKTLNAITPVEIPMKREKRVTPELGQLNVKDKGNQDDASALRDELDMLQEENEVMLEKLRHAEEKREEVEARARELEKQRVLVESHEVSHWLTPTPNPSIGCFTWRRCVFRSQIAEPAALKAAKQKYGQNGEMTTLRAELETLKEEAATTMNHLQEVESEAKNLRSMTQRMILTQEEMEEVVLKRCWLARYWGLAVQYGICADISVSKHEYWSAFAPVPFELVISAGQKAKDDFLNKGEGGPYTQNRSARDPNDLTGEGNIESMLSVEMGLRELASLKIEDAVVLAMAQRRRPNLVRDTKSPADTKFMEAFELDQDESDDVLFKQAWLIYFWKRARDHGVEEDISDERLQSWISRSGRSPTFHDAVDVDHGFIELRKLAIEQQLWEASRKEIELLPAVANGSHKHCLELETL